LYSAAAATSFVGEDGEETPYPTPDPSLNAEPTTEPTNASDSAWVTDRLFSEMLAYDCSAESNDPAHEPFDEPLITCDESGVAKYILGPVELDGSSIDDAQA